jgi:SWI/SNF-related matrix-associated actin-dependent regulator 1 of chromatin subfamily A
MPFQKEGVRIIDRNKGVVLLADDMRLGKTVQTLRWLKNSFKQKTPVVVVCPSIAKWVWKEQAEDNFGLRATVLEGTKIKKNLLKKKLIIINYEILWNWLPYLKRRLPKTVIMDECHYIKNPSAKRTKATRRLAKGYVHVDDGKDFRKLLKGKTKERSTKLKRIYTHRARHLIAISGTPLVNRPAELFPALNILWPKAFNNFPDFGARYCAPELDRGAIVYRGAENLGELHTRLKKLGMIRRLKSDVIKDYKEPCVSVVPLDIKHPESYYKRHKSFLRAVTKHLQTQQERMGSYIKLKQLAGELKLPSVLEWLGNFLEETNDKIVVFAHHQKVIKAIKQHFKDCAVVIDGTISHNKRLQAQTEFAHNKKIRIFIGNIQACGMAVSLKTADTIAFAELPYTPGDLKQCEDRIFDVSKNKQLFIYHLIAKGTIERIVARLLQDKAKIIGSVLDGKSKDMNVKIYTQLENMLRMENEKKNA